MRTARVRAQLVATSDPFGPPEPLDLPPESDDPEAAFLRLQAWHAARFAIEHLPERLAVADQAVELGRRTGTDEYAAWGRRWRMDAYAVLGDRIDLIAEANALRPLVARLARPDWTAYLLLVDASQRLLEGQVRRRAGARRPGRWTRTPRARPAFFHLVFTSAVAMQTGRDLPEQTEAVRAVVDGMPYLAGGWVCVMYKAGGRREEAEVLWRAHRPARAPLPRPRARVGDRGRRATRRSAPGSATPRRLASSTTSSRRTPGCTRSAWPARRTTVPSTWRSGGSPRRTATTDRARSHLTAALRAVEAMHATPYQALVLAELGDPASTARARALATRLGMEPLLARLRGPADDSPLSRRESEIAALVADGLSNAAIAARLTLSERTVENHVSHVLRKLDLTSRAGIASWHARVGG